MFHEPAENFLYAAYKVELEYHDELGNLKSGIATAFILDIANGIPLIVTNRHVIDFNYKKKTTQDQDFILHKFLMTGRRLNDSTYTFKLNDNPTYYFHDDEENDIVLIEARGELNGGETLHWHFGMEHLADAEIFKTIQPFDLICFSGFPDQHDKFSDRPIIRSGHIASDPKYDYSWSKESYGQCVAYEGFSSAGASGSPIFAPPRGMGHIPNSRNGYLIGVNAGHIDDSYKSHSGISYFYKSTVILEIIEKHNLKDKKLLKI
jgi:hypothetical protein